MRLLEPHLYPRSIPWRASFANDEPKVDVCVFLRPLEGNAAWMTHLNAKSFKVLLSW